MERRILVEESCIIERERVSDRRAGVESNLRRSFLFATEIRSLFDLDQN